MGNKYSELSDLKINKLIADRIGYEYEIAVCFPEPPPQYEVDYQYINKKVTNNKKFWVHMDYCKYYKDAMSLMIDNEISLRYISLNGKWEAIGGIYSDKLTGKSINTTSVNENPCRAIAECYLLMKDEENNNGK